MVIFTILVVILLSLNLILYMKFLISRRTLYKLSWSLPGPIGLPFIGNGLTYYCKKEDFLDKTIEFVSKYPSPMRFWFGPKFTIIFKDADHVAKILTSTNFLNKDDIYNFLKVADGEGLLTSSGQKWKRDRKLMSSLFLKSNIEQYLPYIENHVKIFIKILEEKAGKPTFNVEKLMHRCVADFINETVLGTKTNAQNGELDTFLEQIDTMYELIHERIVKVWLQVEWIFNLTSLSKTEKNITKNIHAFLKKNLQDIEHKRKVGQLTNSVVDLLLDIRDQHENFADDMELVHHLTTFYTASEDTITTISSFALILFGMYPIIQEKIYEEIIEVVGDVENINLNDIAKMSYLDMCIKDVLRLFPIGPYLVRVSAEDFQIDNIIVPKGCSVIFATYNLHRDSKHWEKPEEFYPEHFLKDAIKKRHPYAFIPFSGGPRGCIGKSYAQMALKIILVTILRHYRIFSDGDISNIKLKADISVRMRDKKYPIKIDLRKKKEYYLNNNIN